MLHKDFKAAFSSPGEFWRSVKEYLGGSPRQPPITDANELERFLETRASHVAQTSLFGYLRTRAGSTYPELFSNDAFMVAVNIAKWQVWLACLSDLAVFAGGLIQQRSNAPASDVGTVIRAVVAAVLERIGDPEEAGDQFAENARGLLARIEATDWPAVGDDDSPFHESPAALVRWAPIIESLMELDSEIVRNSVRFRWQEVRRDLRVALEAGPIMTASAGK